MMGTRILGQKSPDHLEVSRAWQSHMLLNQEFYQTGRLGILKQKPKTVVCYWIPSPKGTTYLVTLFNFFFFINLYVIGNTYKTIIHVTYLFYAKCKRAYIRDELSTLNV